MTNNSGRTKAEEIASKLYQMMESGDFKESRQLPPENKLAALMGVSRPVIREALCRLEKNGFVSRKHGIGTIINHHVIRLKNRMDMEKEFESMVREAGFEPGIKYSITEIRSAYASTAEKLRIREGDEIIINERVITADDKPVILCRDCIPRDTTELSSLREEDAKALYQYLVGQMELDVHTCLTEISAEVADEDLSLKLEVPLGTPLLKMTEVGYDQLCEPVITSIMYYVNGYLKTSLLRRRNRK